MDKQTYALIEDYMLSCMDDSAHDKEHIYRVLYRGLEIARTETGVNYDILIAACLLHDIGRREQFDDPTLCHAMVGGEKARRFLLQHGFAPEFAEAVKQCIQTHRFRQNNQPQSIEAKILFDADKLEAAGATGIARTLVYQGIVSDPLYSLTPEGFVSNGDGDATPSFFREYKYKLEGIYDRFYTQKGAELAAGRREAAAAFYDSLFREVSAAYETGRDLLKDVLV